MKKEKKKKIQGKDKKNLIVACSLIVLALAISIGTYAYYQSTITGTVSGTVLAWNCTNTGTTNGTLNLNNLMPGSSGNFTFVLKSTNFKTDMTVTMKFVDPTNVPANLKFYKESTTGSEITMVRSTSSNNPVTAFSDTGVAKNSAKTYTVVYNWPYGNTVETPIATGTANKTFQIAYEITCKQSATQ